MNVLNFGGGEIWEGIKLELQKRYPQATYLSVQRPKFDVSDEMAVMLAYSMMPKPDLVIYTAGVSHIQRFGEMNANEVREEFNSNILGAFHVANVGVFQKVGAFIFLVSVAGLYGKPNHAGYSASKMALRSMIESLAMEGYEAYGISPGRVDTKMRERDYPGEDPRTRLSTQQVAGVVQEILDGKHQSGDNIIIRKRGYRVLRRRDRNRQWKEYLNVQPL